MTEPSQLQEFLARVAADFVKCTPDRKLAAHSTTTYPLL
jgi:hypothetical protein